MSKLDSAVDGISSMTKTFASDDIHNLFGPLGDFFKSHKDELGVTIENITNITGQIASGQGTVGKLIYHDELYSSAMTTVSNLQTASASAQDMIASIKQVVTNAQAGQGTVGKLLTDDSLFYATKDSMTNLRPNSYQDKQRQRHACQTGQRQGILHQRQTLVAEARQGRGWAGYQGPLSILGLLAGPLGL